MKKKQRIFNGSTTGVFLLALMFLFGETGTAQDVDVASSTGLSITFKTGLSSGTFTGVRFVEVSDARNGFHVCGGANFRFNEILGIEMDVGYIRSGAVNVDPAVFFAPENLGTIDKVIKTNIVTNALNVPLKVMVGIPNLVGSVKPYIIVGGDFSYYFGAKALNVREHIVSENSYRSYEFSNIGSRISPIDFGVLAGTGLTVNGRFISYLFEMNYRVGLYDINEVSSTLINSNIQNNIFSVSFGVAFNL